MSNPSQVTVALPPKLSRYVQSQVQSGKYQSASDVICEGLRRLEQSEIELAGLREKIEVGWQQIQRGETVPAEQVFEEIRQLSKARRAQSKS